MLPSLGVDTRVGLLERSHERSDVQAVLAITLLESVMALGTSLGSQTVGPRQLAVGAVDSQRPTF